MNTRYAIYYAPAMDTRWWQFGSRWLGRDALSGKLLPQFRVPGIRAEELREITAEPRRYGFHATLKPPFALPNGTNPDDLYQVVEMWARQQCSFDLGPLKLRTLGGFLAVAPESDPMELAALAASCVEELDAFRASPSDAELARRRKAGLTRRQDELLLRWGYPYVMDAWRFHMTLTGRLPDWLKDSRRGLLEAWLNERVRELRAEALAVDALCVFEQASPGTGFRLAHRFAFGAGKATSRSSTARGRLFYVAGASGAGKDSLMAYARARLAGHTLRVAPRHITRVADAGGEAHLALTEEEFAARAARGEFAMQWRSNGHHYGIGTEIDHWLDEGIDVLVNGSREYLPFARERYPDMTVVWVSASEATLRERLARRGREDDAAVASRLERAARFTPPPDAVVIDNDGALEDAGKQLVLMLTGSASAADNQIASVP